MDILLVEDNEMLAKGLVYSLQQHKFSVIHKVNQKETIEFLEQKTVNLAILDVSLPDGNGFSLYEKIVKSKNIPTVFLTAKDEEDDIVKGLELGADDYITKPFSTRELLARIQRILRKEKRNSVVTVKNITFDFDKMTVYKEKQEITLTSLELKLLSLLFSNLNKVVTRNDMINKIWEWTGNDVNDNTVTVYLKRIREKLDTDIIITMKGIGYRVDSDEK